MVFHCPESPGLQCIQHPSQLKWPTMRKH
jgi:hypothetical protein